MTTERPASPGPRPAGPGGPRPAAGGGRPPFRGGGGWWRTRRRPGWLSAQTRQASLLCAAQDLHLLRGQGEAHRLQGCGQAEALHIGPLQDGGSAQDGRVLEAPARVVAGDQARAHTCAYPFQPGSQNARRRLRCVAS
ncbi:hypothetical protein GBAR_LOCUS5255 [Geodia barretti]|uniref:Uncharacterized protein n=1 Tax=Geodia barretti TaxID=519541 RepID=A0AA35RC94_GEOBA|nr:hypothetical protein GBAR_LOCUS5255 [Geodia barretti]